MILTITDRFKDEGGKDKCIELIAHIVDENEVAVRGRETVPLMATLIYENGLVVPQQNILQISPDSKAYIDTYEPARIKLRINEVSMRHLGQAFQLKLHPDVIQLPSAGDICPALSVPVEVKSKRNKEVKRKEGFDMPGFPFVSGANPPTGMTTMNPQAFLSSEPIMSQLSASFVICLTP